jgi:hypothetical protein
LTKTAEEEDVIKHDELLFGLVQKRMYDELDRTDKLDSKATGLISLSGVLAGFFLGIVTNQITALFALPKSEIFVLLLGIGLLIASVFSAFGPSESRSGKSFQTQRC